MEKNLKINYYYTTNNFKEYYLKGWSGYLHQKKNNKIVWYMRNRFSEYDSIKEFEGDKHKVKIKVKNICNDLFSDTTSHWKNIYSFN